MDNSTSDNIYECVLLARYMKSNVCAIFLIDIFQYAGKTSSIKEDLLEISLSV